METLGRKLSLHTDTQFIELGSFIVGNSLGMHQVTATNLLWTRILRQNRWLVMN